MLHNLFTVYDAKVAGYLRPFFAQTKPVAARSFSDAVNQPDHEFNRHPEDYTLFHLGTFEDTECRFQLLETPDAMGVGVEYINPTSKGT